MSGFNEELDLLQPDVAALFDAARAGDVATLQKLKDAGASLNSQDNEGMTVVQAAARAGRLDAVKFLIENGAEQHSSLATPLHEAVAEGYMDVARYLIGAGADMFATDAATLTPFDHARRNAARGDFLRLMIEHMDEKQRHRQLFSAAEHGAVNVLEAFADVAPELLKARKSGNQTVLLHAVNHDQVAAAAFLLSKGCDLHAKNDTGYTALHIAAARAHKKDMIDLLSNAGASFTELNNQGETPEQAALWRKRFEAAEWLRTAEKERREALLEKEISVVHRGVVAKPMKQFVLKK